LLQNKNGGTFIELPKENVNEGILAFSSKKEPFPIWIYNLKIYKFRNLAVPLVFFIIFFFFFFLTFHKNLRK